MCGIAGFSLAPGVDIDASAMVRLLIAGLAERGEDACGFAWRDVSGRVEIVKAPLPPLRFLAEVPIIVPPAAREVIVHVRDFTKGHPANEANNHPIRHGSVTGVHNGIIQNDDELFTLHGRQRAVPGMTVDSEAIFMMLDLHDGSDDAWAGLIGSYATAFFLDQDSEGLHLVRGDGRPLLLGRGPALTTFASTRHALEFVASRLGLGLDVHGVPRGRRMLLHDGTVASEHAIEVTPFTERTPTSYELDAPHAVQTREMALDQLSPGDQDSGVGQQSA